MTQEEKQLLLKDLCARLPYKVFITIRADNGDMMTDILRPYTLDIFNNRNEIKPYLRPMLSMTEEEKELMKGSIICFNELEGNSTLFDEIGLDWLNSHHFDFRGLIEMGLALEAPEGMYKNE